MKKEYHVRPYQHGDEEEIVQLLQLVFNGWPHLDLSYSPLDYWKWKYQDSVNNSFIAVTEFHGEIIGCHHSINFRVKIGDELFLCSYGTDMAVHQDYRRRGISKKQIELINLSRKRCNVKFVFMIANPITLNNLSKYFPKFPLSVMNLVRIRDLNLHLRMIPIKKGSLMKLGYHIVKMINHARNSFSRSESTNRDIHLSEISYFDDRIDRFWNQILEYYHFIVERSGKYLNWRYCDSRGGGFIIRQVEEDSEILGYSVLRINKYREDYPIGYIVDLVALPDRMDVADLLVKDAVEIFDARAVNIVNYQVVKNHPYVRVAKRYGFLDSRIKPHLFYNSLGKKDELRNVSYSPASRIFLSWGDHDVLPVDMPSY